MGGPMLRSLATAPAAEYKVRKDPQSRLLSYHGRHSLCGAGAAAPAYYPDHSRLRIPVQLRGAQTATAEMAVPRPAGAPLQAHHNDLRSHAQRYSATYPLQAGKGRGHPQSCQWRYLLYGARFQNRTAKDTF